MRTSPHGLSAQLASEVLSVDPSQHSSRPGGSYRIGCYTVRCTRLVTSCVHKLITAGQCTSEGMPRARVSRQPLMRLDVTRCWSRERGDTSGSLLAPASYETGRSSDGACHGALGLP